MTAGSAADGGTKAIPRARRFQIHGVVQYRTPDAPDWGRGSMINVSRSGVLFAAPEPLAAGTALELVLDLPSPVRATAVIARTAQGDSGWFVGARFDELSFVGAEVDGPAS